MDFENILCLLPFLELNKPINKQKIFMHYAMLTRRSFSSFNHVLFELRAFGVLKQEKRGFFVLNKKKLLGYLKLCYTSTLTIDSFKRQNPDWWKKWGKMFQELLISSKN